MTDSRISPQDLVRIRRRDRAVTDDAWIIARLREVEYGVLALCDRGWPFPVTRNFVYDASRHCLYLHGARRGRTYEAVKDGARAAFTVSRMGRLLPADVAAGMSVEYSGVVLFGQVTVVDDPQEARAALQALVDKYFPHLQPGRDYQPAREADLKVTAVLRLDIAAWSGKEKSVPLESQLQV